MLVTTDDSVRIGAKSGRTVFMRENISQSHYDAAKLQRLTTYKLSRYSETLPVPDGL